MSYRFKWMKKLSPVLRSPDFVKPDKNHRLLVELSRKNAAIDVFRILSAYNGKVYRQINLIPLLVIEIPFFAIKEIAQLKHVKKIWYDPQVKVQLRTAVPMENALLMPDLEYTGKNITIAVLDTGIFPHHDLTTPDNRIVAWCDILNQRPRPYDDNGHGTHIAGIIAGNGISSRNKFRGIAPTAKLAGIKVLDKNGMGWLSDIISGIEWCIQNHSFYNIKVINLSVGLILQDINKYDPLSRITRMANRKGIVICAAASFDNPHNLVFPCLDSGIITVGNRDDFYILSSNMKSFRPSYYKNHAFYKYNKPDLLVPGTRIVSLRNGGGYRSLTGISMSTALLSGVIAQLLEKQPYLNPFQIKRILKKNATIFNTESDIPGIDILNIKPVFCRSKHKRRKQSQTLEEHYQKSNLQYIVLRKKKQVYTFNPYFVFLIFVLLILSFPPDYK